MFEVVLLLDRDAEDVAGGEDPASSARALVRHRGALGGDAEVEVLGVFEELAGFLEDGVGVCCGEGGVGEAVFGVFEDLGDVFFCLRARDVGGVGGEDVAGGVAGGDADGVELLVEGGVDGFGVLTAGAAGCGRGLGG